jgi:hypothetical protein
LIAILFLSSLSSVIADDNDFKNVTMKRFVSPKYNEKTNKLEYILTGKNAQTIGAFIKITDAKIEMIGKLGKRITSVITSPEAFFNRSTQIVRGDKPIHYQSLTANIDGIGFDCNMKTQLLHVRNNVKMLITSTDPLQTQNNTHPTQSDDNNTVHAKIDDTRTEKINGKNKTALKTTDTKAATGTVN